MSSSLFSVRSTIFVLNSILYIKLNINTVLISYREDNAVSLLFTMSTQNLVRLIFLGTLDNMILISLAVNLCHT